MSTTEGPGLDSSFAASNASTRRFGAGEGGGQEEEGASNHTEDDGGSYTEGEGTIEGMGSSIQGSGGESCLSEQVGLVGMLFQLLHRRRHPSRRSRSHPLRPQRAFKLSALLWGSAEARVTRHRRGEQEGTSGDGGECRGKRGDGRWQSHEQWRRVLGMTRGCTDGTGPWPVVEP